jgi:LacI family transcriptional regulator
MKGGSALSGKKTHRPAKVRLSDIAAATGYSINTVSHALKDKPDISDMTKQLIRQKAQELGYIADAVAGSLRSGRTRTIAVILGDMANPHFGLWVREIETKAFSQGYSTLIMNTDEEEFVEREAIRTAVGKRVDGLILCPTQKSLTNLDLIKKTGIPYVLIGRRFDNDLSPSVIPDDFESGRMAADYLLGLGCRQILMLGGPPWISSARDREAGFCQAHHDHGLDCPPQYRRKSGIKSGQVRAELEQVVNEKLPFDAILAFSDLMALEAMSILQELPVNLPDLPVVGFDDILSGLALPVSLVSVAAVESVAERALALLMQHLERPEQADADCTKQIVLAVRLVEHG